MFDKKEYANGQKVYELTGNRLTYYYKNGRTRAEGLFEDEQMQGEWIFYRESGQLWQTGNFINGKKHGEWIRFNRAGEVEYHEQFVEDKLVK